jgi:hypothetical protein
MDHPASPDASEAPLTQPPSILREDPQDGAKASVPRSAPGGAAHSDHNAMSKEGQKGGKETSVAAFTCPMHPDVVSDKPGKCPKCGMILIPKEHAP